MNLGDPPGTKKVLTTAYKVDKKNKDVRKALAKLKGALIDAKKKEKAAFGGLFRKVDMYGDKQSIVIPKVTILTFISQSSSVTWS